MLESCKVQAVTRLVALIAASKGMAVLPFTT
jgi:hypothetical protein